MTVDLKGQTAIVTGASSGIGEGVAYALGEAGANIVVNYASSQGPAEEAAEKLRGMGVQASIFKADVSSEADVQAMFAHAVETYGTVDILVNNAGLQKDALIGDMTLDMWNRVIAVNLTGQFLCAREAIKEFRRRGMRDVSKALGKIICISSVHEVIPWAGHINYAASKGGVMLLMKSIAQEVGPEKIRVNSVSPGAIKTPINKDAWGTPEAYNALLTLIPTKRIGEVEDIGRVVAFLASDEADYVHGASLFVDGGMTLYPGFADNG
ncbi:MAG: SDR family oxidoreductase [Myxococcota bacterium]